MSRLIDVDAFSALMKQRQDAVKEWMGKSKDEKTCARAESAYVMLAEVKLTLDQMPTIDAVEVVHGSWEKAKPHGVVVYSNAYAECSSCHSVIFLGWEMKYCPNCGAKMKGEEQNNE